MEIEIVNVDLPLGEISRVARRMAKELDCKVRWDGDRRFLVTDNDLCMGKALDGKTQGDTTCK